MISEGIASARVSSHSGVGNPIGAQPRLRMPFAFSKKLEHDGDHDESRQQRKEEDGSEAPELSPGPNGGGRQN